MSYSEKLDLNFSEQLFSDKKKDIEGMKWCQIKYKKLEKEDKQSLKLMDKEGNKIIFASEKFYQRYYICWGKNF